MRSLDGIISPLILFKNKGTKCFLCLDDDSSGSSSEEDSGGGDVAETLNRQSALNAAPLEKTNNDVKFSSIIIFQNMQCSS